MYVNVDGVPERGRMTEGQHAAFYSGWALIALGFLVSTVGPEEDAHGVAAITAGSLLVLISTMGPGVAERLARPAPSPALPPPPADIAELAALMLRQRAELESRMDAVEAHRSDLDDRFDHTMSILGGMAQGFAEEADRLRKTS